MEKELLCKECGSDSKHLIADLCDKCRAVKMLELHKKGILIYRDSYNKLSWLILSGD